MCWDLFRLKINSKRILIESDTAFYISICIIFQRTLLFHLNILQLTSKPIQSIPKSSTSFHVLLTEMVASF